MIWRCFESRLGFTGFDVSVRAVNKPRCPRSRLQRGNLIDHGSNVAADCGRRSKQNRAELMVSQLLEFPACLRAEASKKLSSGKHKRRMAGTTGLEPTHATRNERQPEACI